ncbi:MAG: hydrogenase maturation nickel metallochaperone HypA [Candidatus Fermentibacteraceae bacterium]
MHELSLSQAIIDRIGQSLEEGDTVMEIGMTVGRLSCVNPASLEFCLDALMEEAGMGSPKIVIDRTPARLRCRECGSEFETDDMYTPCPGCGAMAREVLSGRDLVVDYVRVESPD